MCTKARNKQELGANLPLLVCTVGKYGALGKLLAGKCWYLEGNFRIWREIAMLMLWMCVIAYQLGGSNTVLGLRNHSPTVAGLVSCSPRAEA